MTKGKTIDELVKTSILFGRALGIRDDIASQIITLKQRYYDEVCMKCKNHTHSDYCETCRGFFDNDDKDMINECVENNYFEFETNI